MIYIALARMPDDQIRGKGKIGAGGAKPFDDPTIVGDGVATVHRGKDAVGAALHRKMQKRHQLRYVAMDRNQLIIDIPRVRGRIPDTIEAGEGGQPSKQLSQPPV